jgi:hypothetical protein
LAKKRDEYGDNDAFDSDEEDSKKNLNINFQYIKKNSEEDIFRTLPEILTKEFNILDFKQEIGKNKTYAIVCAYIFEKNNLFNKIYKETFIRFIEEMNEAYINKNPYHNVI